MNRRPRRCPGRFEPVHRQARINEVEDDHSGDREERDHDDVMKAVQGMQKKAQRAENLKPTSQLNVQDDQGQIDIAPVDDSWKKVE